MSGIIELYKNNKIVKFCTNWTAILAFIGATWQGGVWAADLANSYVTKIADERSQIVLAGLAKEQQEQRGLLNFIYYDSLKREKSNLEREIFELRQRNRNAADNARLEQLKEDLEDLKKRLRQQEEIVRGQR